ncbi:MAG TPA: hypothetical protein VHO29_16870 [Marmoricola sp.]|nr:hypothetical protein [Marmoricola sp.]
MSTALCPELLELLRQQLPGEFDELAFFASADPLTFFATVMSADAAGRIRLSAALRAGAHRGLLVAASGGDDRSPAPAREARAALPVSAAASPIPA